MKSAVENGKMSEMKEDAKSIFVMRKLIDNIENQFETVLENHENDFMAAYRVSIHINNILTLFVGTYDQSQERTHFPPR